MERTQQGEQEGDGPHRLEQGLQRDRPRQRVSGSPEGFTGPTMVPAVFLSGILYSPVPKFSFLRQTGRHSHKDKTMRPSTLPRPTRKPPTLLIEPSFLAIYHHHASVYPEKCCFFFFPSSNTQKSCHVLFCCWPFSLGHLYV